eukprot:m.244860 g.244860  ORF g.244860 m.244860 type:complete len:141 (+) comp54468_c0_seq6:1101-1523(+)
MVIGVTNPFFSQSFKSFPAVFRVAEAPSRLAKDSHSKVALSTMHFKPGLTTSIKQDLTSDAAFLKELVSATNPLEVNSLIHRFFNRMTDQFMNPLERYISRLMPLRKTISALRVRLRVLSLSLSSISSSERWFLLSSPCQ